MLSNPLSLMVMASSVSLQFTSAFISLTRLQTRAKATIVTVSGLANSALAGDVETPLLKGDSDGDCLISAENKNHVMLCEPMGAAPHHDAEEQYWFDSARIHTLGNDGFMGAVHAASAPLCIKLIDMNAYDGIDDRSKQTCKRVARGLAKMVDKENARVLDMCCGVGLSTKALTDAFPRAKDIMGVDTSPQMVAMADFMADHLSTVSPLARMLSTTRDDRSRRTGRSYKDTIFVQGHAEHAELPDQSFDLITVMYAFHETPMAGRMNILQEARRLLQPGGTLAVVDICTTYEPSASMLMGEPYVREYQQNIHQQLRETDGLSLTEYKSMVPGQVGMSW